jgi:biopolymer transport protein ExbD
MIRSLGSLLTIAALAAACQPSTRARPFAATELVVSIDISADGTIRWNDEPITIGETRRRLGLEAARNPQPEIHVQPDPRAHFKDVSGVMVEVQRVGLAKLGVVGGT